MERRDVVVIGGGPAGYVAAIRVRQLGGTVTLVESETPGGACLHRGCIPTRALVRGVEFLELAKKAREYGISFDGMTVDFPRMVARKDTIVRTLSGGLRLLLEGNGVEVVKGAGKLLSPSEVEVAMENGGAAAFAAGGVILATGARPSRPEVPGADLMMTTDEALSLSEVPGSVLIVGGGAIGMTFATIFGRLGAAVTVVEESQRVLPGVDGEIVALIEREMKRHKAQVMTRAAIIEIGQGAGGEKAVRTEVGGEEQTVSAGRVLLAERRQANLEGLGLEAVGVAAGAEGIEVNQRMETGVSGLFAAGDAVGEPRLAHVAFAEGRVAAENAMGRTSEMDYAAVPRSIHTFPEVACVGLAEEDALAQGYEIRVGRFPLAANGIATVLGERGGMVKVVSEAEYGQILGVHVIGPGAGDLIAEAALAMKLESTPAEIAGAIHLHPSLGEALMEAAMGVSGEALHFLSPDG